MPAFIDLSGRKFNRLKVINRSTSGTDNRVRWDCICDCGNKVTVRSETLRSGHTKSCGCLRKELTSERGKKHALDLSNQRFGRLIAIKPTKKRSGSFVVWECKCGKIAFVSTNPLMRGTTTSCGCYMKEINRIQKSKPKGEASLNALYASYKRSANDRNIEFKLNLEEFSFFINQTCHYCGSDPSREFSNGPNANGSIICNGIDRENSNKGYVFENCVPCCATCNYAKRDNSVEEFIEWIKDVYFHFIIDTHEIYVSE